MVVGCVVSDVCDVSCVVYGVLYGVSMRQMTCGVWYVVHGVCCVWCGV